MVFRRISYTNIFNSGSLHSIYITKILTKGFHCLFNKTENNQDVRGTSIFFNTFTGLNISADVSYLKINK